MFLTKSDFKIARECPTKLSYKKRRYPSLLDDDPFTEFLADGGYMVEKMAKLLFPEGVEMERPGTSPEEQFASLRDALQAEEAVLFEATALAGVLLARIDILEKRGNELRLIEVKATSVNMAEDGPMPFRGKRGGINSGDRDSLEDVTFQALVLRRAFPEFTVTPVLGAIDKSRTATENATCDKFRLTGTGGDRTASHVEYLGDPEALREEHLLALVEVGAEVDELMPEIEPAADALGATLRGDAPTRWPPTLGIICKGCEYRVPSETEPSGFAECWGTLADVQPHLLNLYRLDGLRPPGRADPVSLLTTQGKASLHDVPEDWMQGSYASRQSIQREHTTPDREYLSAQLGDILAAHKYPLHFIDFEASRVALPYHAGMTPYQQLAFQWSCHTIEAPGAELTHREWINLEPKFPNFEFAKALREAIGDEGTVYVWSHFEQTALREIRTQMDARGQDDSVLASWLDGIGGRENSRVVDMEKLVKKHHFHPRMGGRTSIKVVLPAVWENDPALWDHAAFSKYFRRNEAGKVMDPYKTLEPLGFESEGEGSEVVAEGTGAIRAYQDLVFGRGAESKEACEALKTLLLQYCELDTAAMVIIWTHWMHAP